MKKLALFVAGLLLAGSAYAQVVDKQERLSSSSNEEKDGGATIEWYGERVGVFRPCTGSCVTVCKRITFPSSQIGGGTIESENITDRYVMVSDGERTVMVTASQVDGRTGAIKTK